MKTKQDVTERLTTLRKIASLKEIKWIERAVQAHIASVFMMTGSLSTVKRYVDLFHSHGVPVFLHVDRLGGLVSDRQGIEYLANHIRPTGIISSKGKVIRIAAHYRLLTVQRMVLMDQESVDKSIASIQEFEPDFVQVMPAILPEWLERIHKQVPQVALIAGGLIDNQSQMQAAIKAGALAVSTSSPSLWDHPLPSIVPRAKPGQ